MRALAKPPVKALVQALVKPLVKALEKAPSEGPCLGPLLGDLLLYISDNNMLPEALALAGGVSIGVFSDDGYVSS